MSVRAMLHSRREVWRRTDTDDGMGGRTSTFAKVGVLRCKVDIPSATEKELADEWGGQLSHSVFLLPSADVRRGDELRTAGAPALRVLAVISPSRPDYRKALCSAVQPEG